MAIVKPGKLKYAHCRYCDDGIVQKEGEKLYSCTACRQMVLIYGDEPEEFGTGRFDLTSPDIMEHRNEVKEWKSRKN